MMNKCYIVSLETLLGGSRNDHDGAAVWLDAMRRSDIPFLLLSEQSGRLRDQLVDLVKEAGIGTVYASEIYTGAMAAVDWILRTYPAHKRAVAIGGKGLHEALKLGEFTTDHRNPNWLIMGMHRNMSYLDYSYALQSIFHGAQLVSVDNRMTQRYEGLDMIGNGAVIKMMEAASGQKALSFGRGSEELYKQALQYLDLNEARVVVVGDDFERDIVPANALGIETVLITRGESIMNMGITNESHPDYIVEDFYGLSK
ncbi:MAG: HAD hydrolase-like protein [Solobacterium sp.]|nr:HAD hydrolase-like protein [Solobacterium sp.]